MRQASSKGFTTRILKKLKSNIKSFFKYRVYGLIRPTVNWMQRWFSYFLVTRYAYDFDYASILEVERHQIKRVRNSINKSKHYVGYENDVSKMDLAIKLLDLIDNNMCIELKSDESYTDEKGYYHPKYTWILTKYVNTRNAHRFVDENCLKGIHSNSPEIHIDNLYQEKLWKLYFKLREQYTRKWWW